MPTGLVKSISHAPGAARRRASSAISQHERHGAQRLGEPARPGRLLPHAAEVERPRLVPVPRRLPADPELDEHRGRAVDAVFRVGGPPDGRLVPVRAHDPRRHRPDHGQPGLVRVDQDQLGDLRREPPEPVRELRRVGRPAADNSEFHAASRAPPDDVRWAAIGTPNAHPRLVHENAFTSAPVWATWHATSPVPSDFSSGVTVAHISIDTGQRGWNRQPGLGSITFGGSPRSPLAAASASRLGGGAFGSGTAESSSWV